jgi:hypothetical protein
MELMNIIHALLRNRRSRYIAFVIAGVIDVALLLLLFTLLTTYIL